MESMTGYGSSTFTYEGLRITIELRSLNSRYLEANYDFPTELGWFIPVADFLMKKKITRGRIDARITTDSPFPKSITLNQDIIRQYQELYRQLSGQDSKIPISDLAQLPGIFELKTKDWRILAPKLEFYYLRALLRMQKVRQQEGKKIAHWTKTHLRYLYRLNRKMENDFRNSRKKLLKNLRKKLISLIISEETETPKISLIPVARKVWSQYREEILNLIQNDIEEEIQRVYLHLNFLLQQIKEKKGDGKQFDFYLQEIQREVNTIAAKTPDTQVNRTAVLMKVEIEKIREQIRNIE